MGLEGQFIPSKKAELAEAAGHKPQVQSFPDILRLFSNTQEAHDAPRAALINRATINRDALREVASFGDDTSKLEYVMLPTPDGAVFYSGGRSSGNPFEPGEEERLIHRSFPLSMFLGPKEDPEFVRAAKKMHEVIDPQARQAEWFAHWHPKGSAANEHGDYPSGADFEAAATLGNVHFMFDEQSVFVFSANGKSRAEVSRFRSKMDLTYGYLPDEIRYSNEVDAVRPTKKFKQDFVEKNGMLCIEIPWEDPRVNEVVAVIRGERRWNDIKDSIFIRKEA